MAVPAIQAKIDRFVEGNGKTKAYGSATIGGAFVIHGLSIINGEKGMFVGMPRAVNKNSDADRRYSDRFHAISTEAREALQEAVLTEYYQEFFKKYPGQNPQQAM